MVLTYLYLKGMSHYAGQQQQQQHEQQQEYQQQQHLQHQHQQNSITVIQGERNFHEDLNFDIILFD